MFWKKENTNKIRIKTVYRPKNNHGILTINFTLQYPQPYENRIK